MTIESHGHEHEFEPQFGLPERLPAGERILWQGSPDFAALARNAFHLRKLALYFSVLLVARAATVFGSGGSAGDTLNAMAWPVLLTVLALASVTTLAWLTARTAVYTVTDQRVVMRIGIVLTLTFNLPLRSIESAALRAGSGGCGDIVLKLAGSDRIAWLHLWPHARPWRLANPEPSLRCVPEAASVAATLAQAWSGATGVTAVPADTTAADAGHTRQPLWQPSPT
jgi:hypothetical protein